MSAAAIISELPKLSEVERRAIGHRLLELVAVDPDIALCNQSAREGAALLDKMEKQP